MKQPQPTYSDHGLNSLLASQWDDAATQGIFHHHNEVEINFLARGEAVYHTGGRAIPLPLRSLCLFWGGITHSLVDQKRGYEIWVFHVPLSLVLSWGLPGEGFLHRLLRGEFLHDPDPDAAVVDETLMRRWHADLESGDPKRRAVMQLECQARFQRLALGVGSVPARAAQHDPATAGIGKILHYIAGHSRDPNLSVAAIARHAGLTANYANNCFRKICGTSIMRYVNQQRVTHAQFLLTTTDAKILNIAMDAGFGSECQFYHVFRELTGFTPREYAKAHGNR